MGTCAAEGRGFTPAWSPTAHPPRRDCSGQFVLGPSPPVRCQPSGLCHGRRPALPRGRDSGQASRQGAWSVLMPRLPLTLHCAKLAAAARTATNSSSCLLPSPANLASGMFDGTPLSQFVASPSSLLEFNWCAPTGKPAMLLSAWCTVLVASAVHSDLPPQQCTRHTAAAGTVPTLARRHSMCPGWCCPSPAPPPAAHSAHPTGSCT